MVLALGDLTGPFQPSSFYDSSSGPVVTGLSDIVSHPELVGGVDITLFNEHPGSV